MRVSLLQILISVIVPVFLFTGIFRSMPNLSFTSPPCDYDRGAICQREYLACRSTSMGSCECLGEYMDCVETANCVRGNYYEERRHCLRSRCNDYNVDECFSGPSSSLPNTLSEDCYDLFKTCSKLSSSLEEACTCHGAYISCSAEAESWSTEELESTRLNCVAIGCSVGQCHSAPALLLSTLSETPTSNCNTLMSGACGNQFMSCSARASNLVSTCSCYALHIQCLHSVGCLTDKEELMARSQYSVVGCPIETYNLTLLPTSSWIVEIPQCPRAEVDKCVFDYKQCSSSDNSSQCGCLKSHITCLIYDANCGGSSQPSVHSKSLCVASGCSAQECYPFSSLTEEPSAVDAPKCSVTQINQCNDYYSECISSVDGSWCQCFSLYMKCLHELSCLPTNILTGALDKCLLQGCSAAQCNLTTL